MIMSMFFFAMIVRVTVAMAVTVTAFVVIFY
jgi:hypothetical protein